MGFPSACRSESLALVTGREAPLPLPGGRCSALGGSALCRPCAEVARYCSASAMYPGCKLGPLSFKSSLLFKSRYPEVRDGLAMEAEFLWEI